MSKGNLSFIIRVLLERQAGTVNGLKLVRRRVVVMVCSSLLLLIRRVKNSGGMSKIDIRNWCLNTIAVLFATNASPYIKPILDNKKYDKLIDRITLILSIMISRTVPEKLVSFSVANVLINGIRNFISAKKPDAVTSSLLNHAATSMLITLIYLLDDKKSRLYKLIIFNDKNLFYDFAIIFSTISIHSFYMDVMNKLGSKKIDKDFLLELYERRKTYRKYKANYSEISNNSKVIVDKFREKYEITFKRQRTKLEKILNSRLFQNFISTSQWCIFKVLLMHIFRKESGRFRFNGTTKKFVATFISLLTLDFGKVMSVNTWILKLLTYYISIKYYHGWQVTEEINKVVLSIASALIV
ncbi:hypothetical protein J7292_02894 [Nakaseomyces glabratus]|nr:hypothetical protein J7298_02910 [Nakaseomyces glabratus]KAH7612990.1 hypothetical protein J7292_02894 [Nakaseomyces glabratus]